MKDRLLENTENIEIENTVENGAMLMETLEVKKLHMDFIMCYWKMLKNTTHKRVHIEPCFEIQKDMAKQVFCKVLMLKHICSANDKMKAEEHRMISLKCGKTRFFAEYARFFVFLMKLTKNRARRRRRWRRNQVFCRANGEQGHMENC